MSTIEKQQVIYEQEFNDCCANIAGLRVGNNGCTDRIYFRDDGMRGTYECKIEDYVPYTRFDQLEPVIEILKSTLGFTVDLETQSEHGVLEAYRSMVDVMLDATADCDNHPYETCAEREEAKEAEDTEDIKQKLVNAHGVKVMDWTRGKDRVTADIYFDGEGNMAAAVATYDPYNNITYMEPVIDSLISGLGLRLDTGLVQTKGILAASRQLILDNIVSKEDKDELLGAAELVCCTKIKEDDTLTELREDAKESFDNAIAFGTTCKNWSNIDDEILPDARLAADDVDILDVEEGWDEHDKNHPIHPMYDADLQGALRENTKRQFEHSLRLNMPYGENGTVSKEVIKGCVGRERFWEDEEDDAEIIMNDFTHVGNPRSIGWQAARILILTHYRGYDDMYIDMAGEYNVAVRGNNARNEIVRFTELVEDGLLQAHKIEAYIRNPENCMEGLWAQVSAENPYIIPPLDNINLEHLHQHRLRIIEGVLYERATEYKTPKDVFNELCQRITKTANAPSYCIDASTFNPYQDILQLSRIVEIILGATGEPFVVDGQDGVDMMEEMRDYVETYSTELYMKLEEL